MFTATESPSSRGWSPNHLKIIRVVWHHVPRIKQGFWKRIQLDLFESTPALPSHTATRSQGTNTLSRVCPYLEIRTARAGGVFACLRYRALPPCASSAGGRQRAFAHRPSPWCGKAAALIRAKPDMCYCSLQNKTCLEVYFTKMLWGYAF